MNETEPSNLEELEGVVAPKVLLDAIETSQLLSKLGVPHALIGGLAVGLYGHPRATKDVDFLVGNAAFESTDPLLIYRPELASAVTIGVVDLMAVPKEREGLAALLAVGHDGSIPVIKLPALVLLKLDAGRPQDLADVNALLDAGADPGPIGAYLAANDAGLADRFAALLDAREQPK